MSELLPDPLEALRLFLRSRPAVTAITGPRISSTLSGDLVQIRLAVIGGEAAQGEGTPRVQVECWGTKAAVDDGTASHLARVVAAEVQYLRGPVAGGGYVVGAAPVGHPFSSPDPVSGRARHVLTVQMHTYAQEGSA